MELTQTKQVEKVKKVKYVLQEDGTSTATFSGDHMTKRQLLQMLKTIKIEYRRSIRNYRAGVNKENARLRNEIDKREDSKKKE